MATRDLTRFGWLSIAASLVVLSLKLLAWQLTGSVGLLSDAVESTVNVFAGVMVLVALRVAAQPPDENHQFGHDKAELFSAAMEGLMIVGAAALIAWTAVGRLLDPRPVERVGLGLALNVVASALNLAVALILVRAGRRHHSLALVADGRHLLTDVWTSGGVIAGIVLVGLTGWDVLDPVIALLVGANIVIAGFVLLYRSGYGLMDPPMPREEQDAVAAVLARYEADGIRFHAMRSRVSGPRRFLNLHVLVPGRWTVSEGHRLLEEVEADLREAVPNLIVFTHLEPVEEPVSYEDQALDRSDGR